MLLLGRILIICTRKIRSARSHMPVVPHSLHVKFRWCNGPSTVHHLSSIEPLSSKGSSRMLHGHSFSKRMHPEVFEVVPKPHVILVEKLDILLVSVLSLRRAMQQSHRISRIHKTSRPNRSRNLISRILRASLRCTRWSCSLYQCRRNPRR